MSKQNKNESSKGRKGFRLPLDDTKGKGSLKDSAFLMVRDTLAGLLGGMVGSAADKLSLVAGAGVSMAGHYFDSRAVQSFGVGMIVANGYTHNSKGEKTYDNQTMQGFSPQKEIGNIKNRVMNFGDNLFEKLPFSLLKKKSKPAEDSDENIKGFGSIEANWNALDEEENKLIEAAHKFDAMNKGGSLPAHYNENEISGMNEEEVEFEELPDNA